MPHAKTARLRVRDIAEQQNLNITTLSRAAEISYSQAWKIWHNKVTQLDFTTLAKLAQALEVPVGELFAHELVDVPDRDQAGNSLPLP
jgi:DNA-binding Xre family transcriptional regulator